MRQAEAPVHRFRVLLFVTVCTLALACGQLRVHAAFTASIALTNSQMANLSIGSTYESFRWQIVDDLAPVLITVFFHSYGNSGLILDEGLISANRTLCSTGCYPNNAQDPNQVFTVQIQSSQPTADAKLIFGIATSVAPPAITIGNFTGSGISDVGLPGRTNLHSVATTQGTLQDVVVNNVWVASFSWSTVKFNNQTVPQLAVYDTSGVQIDGRYVTKTDVELLPVRGAIGFWVTAQQVIATASAITSVTWLLESSFNIVTHPNNGFTIKPLPRFSPDQSVRADFYNNIPLVNVWWVLPIGANQYTVLIANFKLGDCGVESIIQLNYAPSSCGAALSQPDANGVYTLTFRPKAIGIIIPVTIATVAPDGKYQSTVTVTTKPDPFWDPSMPWNATQVIGLVLLGVFMGIIAILAYRRRKPARRDPNEESRRLLTRNL